MTSTSKGAALLLGLQLLFASAALAEPVTPEQRARAYFEALQRDGFNAVAAFLHPDEQVRFRELLLPLYRAEAREGNNDLMAATFGDGTTVAQLQAMDAGEFCDRFLKFIGASTQAAISFESLDVLGAIPEGERLHVVTRMKVGVAPLYVTRMEVLTLAQYQGEWKVMLSGQMEGVAAALAEQLGVTGQGDAAGNGGVE